MSLQEAVKRGDWVRATTKNGSVIEGQSTNDMPRGGLAAMSLTVSGDGGRPIELEISVNYWDVVPVRRNLL